MLTVRKNFPTSQLNLAALAPDQRRALLDLALLTQYADGHLAAVEDERIRKLLAQLGLADESAAREYDAAAGRIRRLAGNPSETAEQIGILAGKFTDHGQRAGVLEILGRLAESDRHISAGETDLLAAIRDALQR